MKRLLVAATVAVVPVVGLLATTTLGATAASARADVGVTIAGNDPSGVVTSSLRVCKAHVTVKLFEQVGARGGGDDVKTSISDTTALQGGRWTYSFGNPGLDDGRYYAKVKGTDRCKPGFSPTIRVDRN
jgi:hypothetical protein